MDESDLHTDLENVIVIGVDGSEQSTAALEWAAGAAQLRDAELRLVCSWTFPVGTMAGAEVPPQSFYDSQRRWVEAVLRTATAHVSRQRPNLVVSTTLSREFPLSALRDHSAHALMTVVGAHGSTALSGLLLGSVAQQLVMHGAGPIVVVRGGDGPAAVDAGGPVVVGLDASDASEDALAFAFQEASFRQVPLIAVRAWDGAGDDNILLSHLRAEDVETAERDEARVLAEQLTGWTEKYPEVQVQQHVLRGNPAATLLDLCASTRQLPVRPALIVVGSRGRGGFLGMLLGSTGQTLASHAVDPLCVVHPRRR